MSPDDIQGPRSLSHNFSAQPTSPKLSPVSIDSLKAQELISESAKQRGGWLPVDETNTASSPVDDSRLPIIHSPNPFGVASPQLGCSSPSSPDEPSAPGMPEHLDLGHATRGQLENASLQGSHTFKTPSPPQTRRRYANLISPGKEVIKQLSGFGIHKQNQLTFYRPDLDELEEWTNANVSPAVFGKPIYSKPLVGAAEERRAIRYNLRTLHKVVETQSTAMGTKDKGLRLVALRYIPRAVQSERIIEGIFGPMPEENESKSESISRTSPYMDANAANLRAHPTTLVSRLYPLSRTASSFTLAVRPKPPDNNKTENASVTRQPHVNGSRHPAINETPQPVFRIDPLNPLHQSDSTIATPKAKALLSSAPIFSSGSVTKITKSLSDPSFNPAFPLSLSPALHRSVFSVSPFIVNQSRSLAAEVSKVDHGDSSTVRLSSEEVIGLISPMVLQKAGSDDNDNNASLTPEIKRTDILEAKLPSFSLNTVASTQTQVVESLPRLATAISHAPDEQPTGNLIDLHGSHSWPHDRHSQSTPPPPSLSVNPTPCLHPHSPHIFVSLAPFSTDSPGAPGPIIQYLQLQVGSPMAPALWNEVEPLPLDSDIKLSEHQLTRKFPVVLDQRYLRPRYRNLWSLDSNNAFLEQAKLRMVIEKARPELYVGDEDRDGAEDDVHDEPDVDERASDSDLGESDLETQDPESGVVFLSQKRRHMLSPSPVNALNYRNQDAKSELGVLVETMRRRDSAPSTPEESASTRRATKRPRTNLGYDDPSPSKRRRKMSEQREVESEDESDTSHNYNSSPKGTVMSRLQKWTSLLHSFLKGKRELEQSDLLDLKKALREINSDADCITPTSPLAGYIYTIANMQPSDIPNNDKMGFRALAKTMLRFWGPDVTKAKVASGINGAGQLMAVSSPNHT